MPPSRHGGVFTWTPTEAQVRAPYTFDCPRQRRRTLADSETITVTVSEVNVAPVLGCHRQPVWNELSLLPSPPPPPTQTCLPNPDLQPDRHVPTGAAITARRVSSPGRLTEAQGPGTTPSLSSSATAPPADTEDDHRHGQRSQRCSCPGCHRSTSRRRDESAHLHRHRHRRRRAGQALPSA